MAFFCRQKQHYDLFVLPNKNDLVFITIYLNWKWSLESTNIELESTRFDSLLSLKMAFFSRQKHYYDLFALPDKNGFLLFFRFSVCNYSSHSFSCPIR